MVVGYKVIKSGGETPDSIAHLEFNTFDDAYNKLFFVCKGDQEEMNKYYIEKLWKIKL